MDKKITVSNFINEYKSFTNDRVKESCLKKHIFGNKYVPYEEKCAICKGIIDASTKSIIDNKEIFRQDTTARYMLYCLKLIDTYTDIVIDFSKALAEFNMLDKEDFVTLLLDNIPAKEKTKIDTILKMKLDDYYENERSVIGFISKLSDKFNFVKDEFVTVFNRKLEEEDAAELRKFISRKIMKK